MRRLSQRFLCIVFSLFLAATPLNRVFSLNESELNYFSQNNILFYDPYGGNCYSGQLRGDTVMAMVVDYLKGNNPSGFVLSDNGIAGVLANFEGESGFNPFRFEGDQDRGEKYGYGIAQFTPMTKITGVLRSDSRTTNFFNNYFDVKYSSFNTQTGFPMETVPKEVINAWLSVQLDYFFGASSEFETTRVGSYRNVGGEMGLDYISNNMTVHEAMNAARTPEDATRIFVWIMERPANKEGASSWRSENVRKWLDYSEKTSAYSGSSSSNVLDGSNVTIIGDSIVLESEAAIKEQLPKVDVYAQAGKQFSEGTVDNPGGISILEELVNSDNLRDILIYALGTNGGATEAQVKRVVKLAGSSKKIVFVTNYSALDDYIGSNNNYAKARNDNPNVSIIDWKSAVEANSQKYLAPNGFDPNEEGKRLYATIIRNVVSKMDSNNVVCLLGALNGGLSDSQAQKLANYYNGPNVTVGEWNLAAGTKTNCVSFSQWFTRYFTGLPWANGDGRDVAHNIAVLNGLEEGTAPRPFAVFSTSNSLSTDENGIPYGHTGIVVTVDGDKITTVEASWPSTPAHVEHYSASDFVNTVYGYTFTYLDSRVNQIKLFQIAGE